MALQWTETELAYFAGIVDGEGCFCLHNSGTHRFSCQLHIGNTDVRLMEWIRTRFGGSVQHERRGASHHKPVWRWYAKATDLDAILRAILPFLVVKKHQAELFIAYRSTLAPVIHTKRSTHDTPEPVKRERQRIHAELAVLNRRGVA